MVMKTEDQIEAIAGHVRNILRVLGEEPDRPGLVGTPNRVAQMYVDMFSGLYKNGPDVTAFDNTEGYDQLVVERGIPVQSLCEHHMLPFIGEAHIGYIPDKKYLGLSKFVRVVEHFSKRPQVQERLTGQIADFIMDSTEAVSVMVVIEAEHTCMSLRGVKTPGVRTTTAAIRPLEFDFPRAEFLTYIGRT